MATTPDGRGFLLSRSAVRRAIDDLSRRRSHEHLPGYLLLHHLGVAENVHKDSADLKEARLKYLTIEGAAGEKHFLQVFTRAGKGPRLDNPNSAGSYSERSIRPGRPLARIVSTAKSNRTSSGITYRLRREHAAIALEVMLKGNRLPAALVAILLFRDFALDIDPQQPEQLVAILRDWLRMGLNSRDPQTFDTLFEDDSAEISAQDFEPLRD